MSATRTDGVFQALADPNRRQIIECLAGDGPATATGLAGRIGITRQGAAKHLAGLADAGIVTSTREGREVRFALRDGGLEPGAVWLRSVGDQWERRLSSLKRHLDV